MKKHDWWFGYDKKYIITHPYIYIGEIFDRTKRAFQRAIIGYDETVSWSLDHYLAEKIPEHLKVIRDHKGIPMLITQDGDFDKNGNFKFGFEEKRRAEYRQIINDIVEGFEAYLMLENIYDDEDLYEKCYKKFDKGMQLFVKYYSTFWW